MELTSAVFKNKNPIPVRYTGEGEDISPPLEWSSVPSGAREFALICEDPDAPKQEGRDYPFVHWVIYNISPTETMLPAGLPDKERMEIPDADQGKNTMGKIGFSGPLPPKAHGTHRYFFKLFALDAEIGLKPGATKDELLKAMQGHVIESAELVGTYKNKASKVAA